MQVSYGDYVLDDALERFDFARCHAWLTRAYWSEGIGPGEVRTGFGNSTVVVGAYRDALQVACLRLISDQVRFAYLMDVFVDEQHRGRGLGRSLVQFALDHPSLQRVVKWTLATHDAHEVYRAVGFSELPDAQRWMALLRPRGWIDG